MKEKLTCDKCNAMCCRYVTLELDCPEVLEDFDFVKWYVAHENVFVFVEEDGTWNIEFITPCKHLDKENKCGIYSNRPSICKDYSHDECPFHNEYKEIYRFEKIEDVDEYIENVFKKGLHVLPKEDSEE
jgi:Fe-S-cluster containining protein